MERKWKEFADSPPRSFNGLYVSVNSIGVIVLNRRTFDALGSPQAVLLLYDEDRLTIGLRPVSPIMPNAFPLVKRGGSGNRIVRALAFLKAHQISLGYTVRFLNAEIEDGILILDLNMTARATQSPRTGWRKSRNNPSLPT